MSHTDKTTPTRESNVLSWATDLDAQTMAQAHRTASLDFVNKPLALMADAWQVGHHSRFDGNRFVHRVGEG